MTATFETSTRALAQSILVERHEGKYIIPREMVPGIRQFIRPFCTPDPNASGTPPEYVITTLQLDTPALSLHHAKEHEAVSRFKLRARTYGVDGKAPIFTEIKRKTKGVIAKSRARVPREKWCKELVLDPTRMLDITFRSLKEEYAFLDFVRLVREIGAAPKVLIRYTRESWISHVDEYARVTFDRNLLYQPTESWTSFGEGGRWITMDSSMTQNKRNKFSGVILEIKAMSNVPTWIVELVQKFNLARVGNCKYSTAIWNEAMFRDTIGISETAMTVFAQ